MKQFDLEQEIMSCWNVTTDLNVLLEELMENENFTKDQASNFVLGLSTIYEAKFEKLFRTFEDFLKDYYKKDKERAEALNRIDHLNEEIEEMRTPPPMEPEQFQSLEDLFNEEEELALQEEQRQQELSLIEDEQAPV